MEALAHAGNVALEGPDIRAAEDTYHRALDLAGSERGWGLREARIMAGLGEARYWLGEFERAIPVLEHALTLGDGDAAIRAQAARFLGDIELSVRGDAERAGALLEDALEAARALGDPWTLARTLLVAGWGPYWRGDQERARSMFAEALDIARANPTRDPWAESRALVALAMLESETGDEEVAFGIASEALAIAEAARDRFSIAVARESVGGTLRRMMRVEEAEVHLTAAIDGFRELGARWELASALTSRGIVRRLGGRAEEAARDLKEAHRICIELKERSIVTWTASMLARAFMDLGDPSAARRIVADTLHLANARRPTGWTRSKRRSCSWRASGMPRSRSRSSCCVATEGRRPRRTSPRACGGSRRCSGSRPPVERRRSSGPASCSRRLHASQSLRAPELALRSGVPVETAG